MDNAPATNTDALKPKPVVDAGVLQRAWSEVLANPIWIGGGAIFLVVYALLTVLPQYTTQQARPNLLLTAAVGVISTAIQTVLIATFQREYLQKGQGKPPRLSGMFSTFFYEYNLIPLGALNYMTYFAIWLGWVHLFPDPAFNIPGIFAVPLLWGLVVFPFTFAALIVVDQREGCLSAMARSWRLVMSAPLRFLPLFFLIGLNGMIGVLLFCFGLAVTLPVQYLATAKLYEDNRNAGIL